MMLTILLLLGLPLLSTGFTARSRSLEKNYVATLVTGAGHLAATLYLLLTLQNPFPAGAWFGIDSLGRFFLLILSHTFFAVTLYSPSFLQRMDKPEYQTSRQLYYPALNSYLLASTLVVATENFGLLWVVIELTTFSLVPMIYFYRSKESLEAVWKYLFLVSLGLVFLLIGIMALGLAAKGAGEHESLVVSDLVRHAAQLDPLWVKISFVFALVGIGAKIGLAPMHPADIDATSNAPGPVAALMAGSLRSTAMLVLLRFYEVACNTSVRAFSQRLLMIAGAFSILVAAVYIWRTRDYKRLLAYSSVEHMGILAIGVSFGAPVALAGVLLHVLAHAAAKGNAFMGAGVLVRKFGTKQITSVTGGIDLLPWSGPLFLIAILALCALPPFGIFRSEFEIVAGGLSAAHDAVAAVFVVLVTVAFLGLSLAANRMLLSPPSPAGDTGPDRGEPSALMVVPVVAGVVALLVLGLHPPGELTGLLARAVSALRGPA
jgi:hydrogenase-4 component F